VARGKPVAEHRRREERGDEQLGGDGDGAEGRTALALAQLRQRAGELLAVGAVDQPDAGEGEHEDRRPAQQAVVAVDPERDEAVGALGVADREAGVGGALADSIGGVGGGALVDRLVEAHVDRDRE